MELELELGKNLCSSTVELRLPTPPVKWGIVRGMTKSSLNSLHPQKKPTTMKDEKPLFLLL
ncbi:unnamed protein product [Brassica rapa]|uniref:Uncharacterized protein n=1 Tax=Brassica campestris TaxID=3711 RepID=A0A8D9LWU1_BRACM|nr:unnamed protein product [Brassica rapa]